MSETAKFKVLVDGPIAGTWRKKGQTIKLRADQAKAYLPPFGSQIEPVGSTSAPKAPSKPSEPEQTQVKK